MMRPLARAVASACLALGGWLAGDAPGAYADTPAETAGDVQDLFFLGGAQSILVRFHIRIGERPLNAAWHDAVAKLHEYLDFSGTGTVGRDEELADFAQVIRGPLSVRARPPSESEQDTTFARIDANGDGTLGPDERDQAARVLRRFDQNDDESISGAELAAFRDPNSGSPAQEQRSTAEPPVLLLDRSGSRIRTLQQVLNRFDTGGPGGAKPKDQRLSRSEIRLAAEVFREFDDNHDGALDSVELMQFLDRAEPAVELIVRLGERPSERPVVEFIDRPLAARDKPGPAPAGSPRVRIRRGDATRVTIELGDLRVDVRTEDTSWDAAQARQMSDRVFQDIDLDDSKSISLAEARGREPFQGLFRVMDRDGDGRIVKGEMNAALALLEDLWRGHARLAVTDRGVLLFGNLDASGDGRLGLRELREASERLASFDRDGDGQIRAAEIPHRFELSLSLAPLPPGFVTRDDPDGPTSGAPRPVSAAGPLWFQKMDRNHDGDLSSREFLGPRDEFLRLDADGDGLISAREATAVRTP
jgi:Ca2+-binding EF-hand superfamily protein